MLLTCFAPVESVNHPRERKAIQHQGPPPKKRPRCHQRLLEVHACEIHIILVGAEVDPLQFRGIKGFVGFVGQGNVDSILMEPGQNKVIQFLTFCLIGGGEDIRDGLIDLRLVLQSLLCSVVAIHRGPHSSQRGLGDHKAYPSRC